VMDRLVVLGGLDVEARRLFIASASGVIDEAHGHINLDCARLDALDKQTLGMLVTVARNPQRRGQRVILDLPRAGTSRPRRCRRELPDQPEHPICATTIASDARRPRAPTRPGSTIGGRGSHLLQRAPGVVLLSVRAAAH
jgi:hypothetical protein